MSPRPLQIVAFACITGCVFACGGAEPVLEGPDDPNVPEQIIRDTRFTVCASESFDSSEPGGPEIVEEIYDFALMTEELLEAPELRAATGLDEVASCQGARRFAWARTLRDVDALDQLDQLDAPRPESTVGFSSRAIWKGDWSGDQRVLRVRIPNNVGSPGDRTAGSKGCSAIAISERHIVTAAHCIPGGAAGYWRVQVYEADPSGSDKGMPESLGMFRTFIYKHHNFSGTGDAADDVALLSMRQRCLTSNEQDGIDGCTGGNYRRTAAGSKLMRVWLGNIAIKTKMDIKGWGTTSRYSATTPRLHYGDGGARISVDWTHSRYFLADDETKALMCAGDSGGPAMMPDGSVPYAAGVASNVQAWPGQLCARDNGISDLRKQKWHRLSGSFANWIEPKLTSNPYFACPSSVSGRCCKRWETTGAYTNQANHTYARCW